MKAPRQKLLDLMALADGELSGDEARAAEALLASDPDAAAFVDNVQLLGDGVALAHDGRSDLFDGFDIADAVMAKVEEAPAPPRGGTVVSLEEARSRARQRWSAAAVVSALAVAAAAAFILRPAEEPMALAPTATVEPASDEATGGVEVTAFGAPGQSVSVYYLPSATSLSTDVVVWIDEPEGK